MGDCQTTECETNWQPWNDHRHVQNRVKPHPQSVRTVAPRRFHLRELPLVLPIWELVVQAAVLWQAARCIRLFGWSF
jgi:hypothetical protein